jgi:bla regulator protein BlaR1
LKSKPAGKRVAASEPQSAYYTGAADAPADLPHIIASGVSTSVQTVAAVADKTRQPDFEATGSEGASVVSKNGVLVASSPSGASAIIYPPDAHGRRKVVATSVSGGRTTTYVDSKDIPAVTAVYAGHARAEAASARAAAMASIGVTPEYVAQMRAVGHRLAALDESDFAEMRAVGVTPEFARDLFASGFPGIDPDDLVQARAVGLTGGYVRAMRSAGVRGDFDDFIQLRAVGIDPGFAARARKSGMKVLNADELVDLRTGGMARPPAPPAPPRAPPKGWNPPDPDPDG